MNEKKANSGSGEELLNGVFDNPLDRVVTENKFLRNVWLWAHQVHVKGRTELLDKLIQAVKEFDKYQTSHKSGGR